MQGGMHCEALSIKEKERRKTRGKHFAKPNHKRKERRNVSIIIRGGGGDAHDVTQKERWKEETHVAKST